MNYFVVGLGNHEAEYAETRHNVGRMFVDSIAKSLGAPKWKEDVKRRARTTTLTLGKHGVLFIEPTAFMNTNGKVLPEFIKTTKDRERTVVFYDDIDLPLGRIKLSYGRSSGGHKGLESVIKALKSKDFLRVRIGITPSTAGGKLKKPQGEEQVVDFVIGKFKEGELEILKKEKKNAKDIVESFVSNGRERTTNVFN